jgi:hypothetical protein
MFTGGSSNPMRVYLSASYSRRSEMQDYADLLDSLGFTVQSRWVRQDNPDLPTAASDDLLDVLGSDVLLHFTEGPDGGGKEVELGIALGSLKEIFIIGPKKNVFHHLRGVRVYSTFWDCLGVLQHFRSKHGNR